MAPAFAVKGHALPDRDHFALRRHRVTREPADPAVLDHVPHQRVVTVAIWRAHVDGQRDLAPRGEIAWERDARTVPDDRVAVPVEPVVPETHRSASTGGPALQAGVGEVHLDRSFSAGNDRRRRGGRPVACVEIGRDAQRERARRRATGREPTDSVTNEIRLHGVRASERGDSDGHRDHVAAAGRKIVGQARAQSVPGDDVTGRVVHVIGQLHGLLAHGGPVHGVAIAQRDRDRDRLARARGAAGITDVRNGRVRFGRRGIGRALSITTRDRDSALRRGFRIGARSRVGARRTAVEGNDGSDDERSDGDPDEDW